MCLEKIENKDSWYYRHRVKVHMTICISLHVPSGGFPQAADFVTCVALGIGISCLAHELVGFFPLRNLEL